MQDMKNVPKFNARAQTRAMNKKEIFSNILVLGGLLIAITAAGQTTAPLWAILVLGAIGCVTMFLGTKLLS